MKTKEGLMEMKKKPLFEVVRWLRNPRRGVDTAMTYHLCKTQKVAKAYAEDLNEESKEYTAQTGQELMFEYEVREYR